ncbi:type VI secretion system protein ImpM (plasmid) [Paraburkholderia sp. PGU19]|uniref:type VI secretion system-associated protein TagF n=1 Tax=Paraburkholderia sp. PGU19 TaxID=2735434 RepID=UPI0015DD1FEE|nr:type VI secretion system-associated protein TagF [Paraburkholderia sp. PGU19]BCG04511.1 type VI secretion system protein ImpM [Paraburkholderia sp. PGU19]
MPGQIMSEATANGRLLQFGWFGKLPGAGDFVNRGMSAGLAAWWDSWVQRGMVELRQGAADGLARYFAVAPVWHFAIPGGTGAGCVQLGCLAPSCDRVGRYYPVVAALVLDADAYTPDATLAATGLAGDVGAALIDAVREAQGPEQLDDVLRGIHMPREAGARDPSDGDARRACEVQTAGWPNLAEFFDPHGATSFWWTLQVNDSPPRTYAHTGRFDARLFRTLFGAPARAAY